MSALALPRPCLMLITDRRRSTLPLLEAVAPAVAAGGVGVDAVQLREPDLPRDELLALASSLREITARRALLLINGDVELALEIGADGVHLPEYGPSVAEVRARCGERLLIGRSVHRVAAARKAADDGVDYVQVGAVYATASHPGRTPGGLALVREVCSAVTLPVIAVGGITPENAAEVLAAGAGGLAVIGAILGSGRPGEAVRRFREVLAGGTSRP